MTDEEKKELIKKLVCDAFGNDVAGVNNRETLRQLKNLVLEEEKELVKNG